MTIARSVASSVAKPIASAIVLAGGWVKRFLLLETGDFLLTEGGDKLIID